MVPLDVSWVSGFVRRKLSAWLGSGMGSGMGMGTSFDKTSSTGLGSSSNRGFPLIFTLGSTLVLSIGLLVAGASSSWAQTDPLLSGKAATALNNSASVSGSGTVSASGLSALLGKSAHVVVTDQVRAELVVHLSLIHI